MTQDIKFHIELYDNNTKPIRHKFRTLNDLQIASLEAQITEWHKNDIDSLHDDVPENGWVSPFHPVLKLNTDPNKPPTIRWCSDMRSLNNHTKPLMVNLPAIEDHLLLLTGSK